MDDFSELLNDERQELISSGDQEISEEFIPFSELENDERQELLSSYHDRQDILEEEILTCEDVRCLLHTLWYRGQDGYDDQIELDTMWEAAMIFIEDNKLDLLSHLINKASNLV